MTDPELIPSFFDINKRGPAAEAFFTWWHADAERRKCFLEQAVGAYCSTFPGRILALLVELLSKP